jgi:hypothetical protein
MKAQSLDRPSKIRFTKHASSKFALLEHYGFIIDEKQVVDTVLFPGRLDERNNQFYAAKAISSKHALRVVYESRKDF